MYGVNRVKSPYKECGMNSNEARGISARKKVKNDIAGASLVLKKTRNKKYNHKNFRICLKSWYD